MTGPGGEPIRRPRALALLLGAEVVALALALAPSERFTRFAYSDSGADLAVYRLNASGLRPTVDFGYIYGLLPVAIGRVWYGAFGPSPSSFRAATLLCALLTAWGLARALTALRAGLGATALVALTMPDLLLTRDIALVHAIEPALLAHALAEQARGRRGRALAIVTACAFAKPSMAYLFGFVLLATVVANSRRSGRRAVARELAPALATCLVLVLILGLMFGAVPLANTLFPASGREVYRQSGYGFFRGSGRDFWWRPGAGLRGYLRYEIAYWLAGTSVLLAGGVAALARLARGRGDRAGEIAATCAGLHAAFVVGFFGNQFSWRYYLAVLLVGLAATSRLGKAARRAIWVVAALAAYSDRARVETAVAAWRSDVVSQDTLGLWATPAELAEWREVLRLVDGRRAAFLANTDGAPALFPAFAPPAGAYFVPGHPVAAELRRKADQIAGAEVVVRVRPRSDPARGGFERWPEIADALDGCETVWEGDFFEVARRVRPTLRPGLRRRTGARGAGRARRGRGRSGPTRSFRGSPATGPARRPAPRRRRASARPPCGRWRRRRWRSASS